MQHIIKAKNLTKKFGNFTAVDHINLSINKGEIFGLLGPNAAGKSTTIRLLSGIIAMNDGEVKIMDYDLNTQTEQVKAHIGYVSQSFALYPELTVTENLDFYSAVYAQITDTRKKELLREYGLEGMSHKRAGILSGGYKRRLSIICALAHDPELIFLDEPTSGIDPVTRKELWEKFYALASQGKTLFVTTHYMEEAERCHNLAFLNHGKIVAEGSPSSLVSTFQEHKVFTCAIRHNQKISQALIAAKGVEVLNQFGEELRVITNNTVTEQFLREIIQDHDTSEVEIKRSAATIEDVFIALTHEEPVS